MVLIGCTETSVTDYEKTYSVDFKCDSVNTNFQLPGAPTAAARWSGVGVWRRHMASDWSFQYLTSRHSLHFSTHARTRCTMRLFKLNGRTTNKLRVFKRLWVQMSRTFPREKHIEKRLDRRYFSVKLLLCDVNGGCRGWGWGAPGDGLRFCFVLMCLYWKQLNTAEQQRALAYWAAIRASIR
jgi:hypothetical protein